MKACPLFIVPQLILAMVIIPVWGGIDRTEMKRVIGRDRTAADQSGKLSLEVNGLIILEGTLLWERFNATNTLVKDFM